MTEAAGFTHAPAQDAGIAAVPSLPFEVAGFTAHNIELPGGLQTAPQFGLLADDQHAQAALRSALAFAPITDPGRPPRVADLGCLEGGYAVEFARAGYEAIGIEAREKSFQRCEFVREAVGLPNLSFVHDDVRNIARHGPFDVVFCCGLLYHLEDPAAFLELIGALTSRLLLLHTHFATVEPPSTFPLGELTEHEGLRGRWYHEFSADITREAMEDSVWASWNNPVSFWPVRNELHYAIQRAGFPLVYEQLDWLGDIRASGYIDEHSRSLFVGAKP